MNLIRFMILYASIVISFGFFVPQLYGGEYKDDFNSDQLNSSIWKITKAGKGSFEIKDGKLYLISPSVADGVILYWNKEITNEDIFIEARIDISGVGTDGSFGFTDAIIDPQLNTNFHPHLNAQFVILLASWGLNDDLRGKPEFKGRIADGIYDKAGGEHIFAVELKGANLIWFVDGKEVGKSERKAKSRFFMISPDQYISHYIGTFAIDYIKLSGKGASVTSFNKKFTTFWGDIKSK
ncbi:MAG: hypothetical protein ACUVWN_03000 [bacterium]